MATTVVVVVTLQIVVVTIEIVTTTICFAEAILTNRLVEATVIFSVYFFFQRESESYIFYWRGPLCNNSFFAGALTFILPDVYKEMSG